MKKIEACFKEIKEYTTPDSVVEHLDDCFPTWRQEIKNREEWESVFAYNIKIYQNTYLAEFANILFDAIGNMEAERMVWDNKNYNCFYRHQAIKRLRKVDENAYLPQYIEALKNEELMLGGVAFMMPESVFDFPTAVDVASEICVNKPMDRSIGQVALEYLAQTACENWDKYSDFIRNAIVTDRDYFIREKATRDFWKKLTEPYKFLLTHRIAVNEIMQWHDINTFYQYVDNQYIDNEDFTRIALFGNLRHSIEEIGRHSGDPMDYVKHGMPHTFDTPTVDFDTNQYTPSKQISNFLDITNTDSDAIYHGMLEAVVRKIQNMSI